MYTVKRSLLLRALFTHVVVGAVVDRYRFTHQTIGSIWLYNHFRQLEALKGTWLNKVYSSLGQPTTFKGTWLEKYTSPSEALKTMTKQTQTSRPTKKTHSISDPIGYTILGQPET